MLRLRLLQTGMGSSLATTAPVKRNEIVAVDTPICYATGKLTEHATHVWLLTDMLMGQANSADIWRTFGDESFLKQLPCWDDDDVKMAHLLAAKHKLSEADVKKHYATVVARNLECHVMVLLEKKMAMMVTVGFGFYGSFGFVNHSCEPNVRDQSMVLVQTPLVTGGDRDCGCQDWRKTPSCIGGSAREYGSLYFLQSGNVFHPVAFGTPPNSPRLVRIPLYVCSLRARSFLKKNISTKKRIWAGS